MTIVGTVAGLVVFLPRVTVEPGGQIDPSRPNPIPFTIMNTGVVPLTRIQPMVGICEIDTGEPKKVGDCAGSLGSRFVPTFWRVNRLAMDEKHTVRLDDVLAFDQIGGAAISIVVTYQPWFIPIRREKEFYFRTRVERDGKLSWLPQALER